MAFLSTEPSKERELAALEGPAIRLARIALAMFPRVCFGPEA